LPYPAPGPPLDFVLEASEKAREGYFKMLAESEDKPKKAINEAIVKWAEANDLKVFWIVELSVLLSLVGEPVNRT